MENGMMPMGYGGNDGIWLFALLILFGMGGFGGFGNRNGYASPATVEDLATQSNFTSIENQARANENLTQFGFKDLGNGICDLGYRLAVDKGDLSKDIATCCCTTNRNIDGVRYDVANYTSAINANITANTQKVLDKLNENETKALYARINQLELAQATANIVRYPTYMTYNAGGSPFCGTPCGGCGY